MNLYKVLIAIMLSTLFTGCTVTQFHYSSTAHIPHHTTSTETSMNVMLTQGNNYRGFGVIAAIDGNSLPYLLIAAKRDNQGSSNNQLSAFNITQATYIDLEAARSFNESLKRIISEWDNLGGDDGYFYEFASVPELEVSEINENTVGFYPSIRFFFNVTNQGSTGELLIGHRNYRSGVETVRVINMNTQNSVVDLQRLIQLGIDRLE